MTGCMFCDLDPSGECIFCKMKKKNMNYNNNNMGARDVYQRDFANSSSRQSYSSGSSVNRRYNTRNLQQKSYSGNDYKPGESVYSKASRPSSCGGEYGK